MFMLRVDPYDWNSLDDKWERELGGLGMGRVKQDDPSLPLNYARGSMAQDLAHGHDALLDVVDVDVPINKPYDEGVEVNIMVYDVFGTWITTTSMDVVSNTCMLSDDVQY